MKYLLRNRRLLTIFSLLFFNAMPIVGQNTWAQDEKLVVKGKVMNAEKNEPVPFAHVFFKGWEYSGVSTDVRGEFQILKPFGADTLVFSHVSYQKRYIPLIDGDKLAVFNLMPKQIEMGEVIFMSGDNPAIKIVEKALANRPINDPGNLDTYQHQSYHKMVFTLSAKDDEGAETENQDILKGGHLFVSESLSEVKYKKPGRRNETVRSSKISGIQDPVVALVSSSFEPFSFYGDQVLVFEMPYLSPISKEGLRKYDYFLEDSIMAENSVSYIISFQPQKGNGFQLGEGLMTISTNRYALENMVFRSLENRTNLNFELLQKNQWNGAHWFPEQINSQYELKDFEIEGRPVVFINQHFISDVIINDPLSGREIPPIALIFDVENNLYPMEDYRRDTLSLSERLTYQRFDDLEAKTQVRINQVAGVFSHLLTGRLPVGAADFLLERLVRINQHEGVALGLGLASGDKLSERLEVDMYFRYGFKDKAWKYGAGASILLDGFRDSRFSFAYSQDIAEIGALPFRRVRSFSTFSDVFRAFLAEKMDQVERFSLEFSQIPIQNWKLSLTASNEKRNPLWTLPGLIDGGAAFRNAFQAVELGLNVNYIYRERNSRIGKRILPGPAEYPLMQMHLSKAFPEILGSDVDFWRMVLRIQHQWKQGLSLHQINMIGMGIWGDNSPISYFNTGFGIRSEDRNLSLTWPGYLQTMRPYEFFSNKAIFASYSYLTAPLLERDISFVKMAPQFQFIQSFSLGSLPNYENGSFQNLQTMDKGYFESGVELQNIIKYKSGFGFQGLGLGAYYRWGAYANPTWQENIFFNLSFNVSF